MKYNVFFSALIGWGICLATHAGFGQNPIISTQFTADPSAIVFGDRVYLYPSHDIFATEGKGRLGWFCMEDYHVFSSDNLADWTDHGVIVTQNEVPWVRPNSYSMWAPDCILRNGKYYFYFPTSPQDTALYGRGFTIGVAIADSPTGPFVPEPTPIKGVRGIDPNVFIAQDGQAYLYWSAGNIYGAKLKENMVELDSEVFTLTDLPTKGLKEGPYLLERNGIYYLTFPHVENKTERLEYAVGDNPLGPFKMTGVIMDESPTGCWTNHHSIIQFRDQWYLFYHHNDYSPSFDKARSVRVDSLFFNADGTIQKVIPTLRGVGVTPASKEIQIDRYSKLSEKGISMVFLDTLDRFKGWKLVFDAVGAWAQYDKVDFGKEPFTTISAKVFSASGSGLEVRANRIDGQVWAKVKIPKNTNWKMAKTSLKKWEPGIHTLFIVRKGKNPVEVDWVRFE
ncbi:MAG: family 43 glycosylhydrolase [Haliscomenobacter sp.]|nr:family 43 glycosylhydrolase [Haliscomenobacter sp.]MBK8042560.1 family 43 glycosylhydrolase [Haliscomenobacter sp.]MBK8657258.1 family 43 glycosylhydrolase [Haliscomenobacter sp.]MBK8878504.1 family 43 glycosylhydrolase [Haliscomenobacter sp.]